MTSVMPELSFIVDAGGGYMYGPRDIRQRCEVLRGTLKLEQGTFISHWRELSEYILPRRARFVVSDVNKGDKRNSKIIDSTATQAAGVLSAGMMSGVTSPARPWFRLMTGDPFLDEQQSVKEWLHEVQRRMETVFLHSNVYNKLPILYGDIGVFATAAMAVMEDDETVIRCYDFPIGSYLIANDAKQRVRTFVRVFRLSVQQIVERWGQINPKTGKANFQEGKLSTISLTVQNLYTRGDRVAWIDICHVVQPNLAYDDRKIDPKYKKFESIYYELGSPNSPTPETEWALLEHGGFDEFPILVARWEVNAEDVYGTNCPGMRALGDIKQLQMGEKRSAQAIEKMLNPPLTGPSRLMNVKVSTIPGDITYDDVRDAQEGIRPIYQTTFNVKDLEEKQAQVRARINDVFLVSLFLMLSQDDRSDITATEIMERKEEKLLIVGPTLEQLNVDVLDPLIDRTFAIMARRSLLPPAPEELQGRQLRVEYVSIMAQAQRAMGTGALERFALFLTQIAAQDPTVLDTVNMYELVQEYSESTGIPPKILHSQEVVAQIRAQQAQAAQAAQAAQNAPQMAKAAKDLSETPTDGDSALAQLLGAAGARQTVNATAQPPVSVGEAA